MFGSKTEKMEFLPENVSTILKRIIRSMCTSVHTTGKMMASLTTFMLMCPYLATLNQVTA